MAKELKSKIRLSSIEWIIIIFIGSTPILFFIISAFVFCNIPDKKFDQGTLGQLGDYCGGILNPVVAYIALISIVITLFNNRGVFQQTMLIERETQIKHMETIAQANAIAFFNAFEDSTARSRNKTQIPALGARLNILQNHEIPESEELIASLTVLFMEWGSVARFLYLLSSVADSIPKGFSLVDAAIAILENDELEMTLLCLAGCEPEFAKRIFTITKNRKLSLGIPKALDRISNLKINGGLSYE